jgi:secreted trypsin-like serine protease
VNRTRPTVLQQVRLGFVPQTNPLCAQLVGTGGFARPGQMCAGFPPKAVCFGDSGGPLMRSIVHPNGKTYWQQVGIMSGTVDCGAQTNYPDIYARVSYYNPWIIDKIRISS